jgi:hypothetical protein
MRVHADGLVHEFAGWVDPKQSKIDVALSQFARRYSNNAFIAELLFPRVPVQKQSNKYYVFGREHLQNLENTLRAPGAAAERIKHTVSTAPYNAEDHALAAFLPDEERGNWEAGGDVEQVKTRVVSEKLMLDAEIRAAALATATGNYAAGYSTTLVGTAQWSDYGATSDPFLDVETAKSQLALSGVQATHMFIGDQVWRKLINHPDVIDRFKYTTGGRIIGKAEMAAFFDIPNIIVASAVKRSAAAANSFIWGKNVIVANIQPTESMEDPSFGKTFVWTSAPGTSEGFQTEIGRVSPPSAKSDEIAVHWYYDQRITGNDTGYLIAAAVA